MMPNMAKSKINDRLDEMRRRTKLCLEIDRQTDRQTDRHADRHADRLTDH